MPSDDPTASPSVSDVTALQQRIADLEHALALATQRTELFDAILAHLPTSTTVYHVEDPDDPQSLRLTFANPAASVQAGFDLVTEVGRRIGEIFPQLSYADIQGTAEILRAGQPCDLGEQEIADDRLGGAVIATQAIPLPHAHVCFLSENITDRKRADAALRQHIAQEATIRAQEATLAELSTPLIPISAQVMVMPLIGTIDARRAQQVLDTLLHGVARTRAHVAIVDITGVPLVDAQVANVLVQAAQAVNLLGAQVVLTGIRPEVAQTLVGLGIDLGGITTQSNLQSGIAFASRCA
jgi:anti-anti-sigma factor